MIGVNKSKRSVAAPVQSQDETSGDPGNEVAGIKGISLHGLASSPISWLLGEFCSCLTHVGRLSGAGASQCCYDLITSYVSFAH